MPQSGPPTFVDDYLPHLAYDCVVFGFSGERLKILILEYHNTGWFALPGGFIGRNEDLDEAVKKGLEKRTGLTDIHLEQFHTFGSLARYRPDTMREILRASGHNPQHFPGLQDRFISVGHYALINYHHVTPKPDKLSDSLEWYPVDELPPLLFDHEEMVQRALVALQKNLDAMLVGVNMLPDWFTIKELQRVHEAILGEKLNRASFQRRMLSSGTLVRHEKRYSGGAHKAPYVYSFVERGDAD